MTIKMIRSSLQLNASNLHKTWPALFILLGLLNGILPMLLLPHNSIALKILFQSLGIICASLLFAKQVLKLAICTLLGVTLWFFHSHLSNNHYSKKIKLPACGAIIEVQVIDPACTGEDIDWLPNPHWLKTQITRYKYCDSDSWRETSGNLALRLPRKAPSLRYGDALCLRGYFSKPSKAIFSGDFNFQRFLKSKKIERIFTAEEIILPLGRSDINIFRNMMRQVLNVRNWALTHLCEQIKNLNNKRIMAALFFGCKQGLRSDERQKFFQSGTIHIFAISGLHVGMLAMFCFFILRFVPFRIRYILVPLILLLYVSTIGFQPSAVRAWLMISLWSFLRAFLLVPNPLNVVFLAAALILTFNPQSILEIGFQYSFIATGFLVFSWEKTKLWINLSMESHQWIPAKSRNFVSETLRLRLCAILAAFCSAFIACLASGVLTLFYQGLCVPLAILANFALLPFLWLLFVLAAVKSIFSIIPGLTWIFGGSIEIILSFIKHFCNFIAISGGNEWFGTAPFLFLPLFYLALFGLISAKKREVFMASGFGLASLLFVWYWSNSEKQSFAAIWHGGESQTPATLICAPKSSLAILINAPSYKSCRSIANYLALAGINRIDSLIVVKTRKSYCAGAKALFNSRAIRRLIIPEGFWRSKYAAETVLKAIESDCELNRQELSFNDKHSWSWSSGNLHIVSSRNILKINLNYPENRCEVIIRNNENGVRTVNLTSTNGSKSEIILENNNEVNLKKIEFIPKN